MNNIDFTKFGQEISIEGNTPIVIFDNSYCYFVLNGAVDLFLSGVKDNSAEGKRDYFLTLEKNDCFIGTDFNKSGNSTAIILSGLMGTKVLKIEKSKFFKLLNDKNEEVSAVFTAAMESSLSKLLISLKSYKTAFQADRIKNGNNIAIVANSVFKPETKFAWIRVESGSLSLFDVKGYLSKGDLYPFTDRIYAAADEDSVVSIIESRTIIADPNFEAILFKAIDKGLKLFFDDKRSLEQSRMLQFKTKIKKDFGFLSESLMGLVAPLIGRVKRAFDETVSDPYLAAAKVIGKFESINIAEPAYIKEGYLPTDPIGEISRASKFLTRQILLRDGWWNTDNGAIYAFFGEEKRPVALIPVNSKSYKMYDVIAKNELIVTEEIAKDMSPFAYIFYKPFPNKVLTMTDILKFGMSKRTIPDIVMVLLIGVVLGFLGMAIPIINSKIFNDVIPSGDYGMLVYLTVFLISIVLAESLFSLARSFALLRFEGRIDTTLETAIWTRLLSLPVKFFKDYSSGDLSTRSNGIIAIRKQLSGAAITSVLTFISSLFQFGLLFYYGPKLAFIALLLTMLPVGLTILSGKMSIAFSRSIAEIEGKTLGLSFGILSGIAKFRLIGAEGRAFSLWSREIAKERDMTFKISKISSYLSAFNNFYPILTNVVIYYFFIKSMQSKSMNIGTFIAFNSAFGIFMNATIQLASTVMSVLGVVPLYERAKPIFEAIPEVTEVKKDPGILKGEIEVKNVNFRYTEKGPLVLKGLSVSMKPGQFIAFVGPSGSGKSTLFRLLLGFDRAEQGTVYIDNQNIEDIDIQSVRRQMGVVLQNGKLMAGDIFSNIIGPYNLTLEDAMQAAISAGLEDDINNMPMGIHTMVPEDGGTLSGGQKQRILIARSIVNKPKVLMFDEATSALDNKTQAIVGKSLEKLESTKIVVAHRLSTILGADHIYVFNKGEIVEDGNYDELMTKNGLFVELVKRQIA